METFDKSEICLDQVRVEEFGGFVYVNLDPNAASLLGAGPRPRGRHRPLGPRRGGRSRHAKRLTYDVATNWKNVIDNFLECYHCHIAHKEFVDLVDMDTYEVRTHGIWSSHFARSRQARERRVRRVRGHRQPARGVVAVAQHLPAPLPRPRQLHGLPGPARRTRSAPWRPGTSTSRPQSSTEAEIQSVRYVDEVLQAAGHRSRRERPARDEDTGVRPGPDRLRPGRVRALGARRAPFPRPGSGRLPVARRPHAGEPSRSRPDDAAAVLPAAV